MKSKKIMTALLVLSLLAAAAAGCGVNEETPGTDKTPVNDVTETESSSETETETETEAETEPETEPRLPDEAEKLEDPISDIKGFSNDTEDASSKGGAQPAETTESVTEEIPEEETEPVRIYNYLNGVTTTAEEQTKRPVAIMLNNIHKCLPQAGLCRTGAAAGLSGKPGHRRQLWGALVPSENAASLYLA